MTEQYPLHPIESLVFPEDLLGVGCARCTKPNAMHLFQTVLASGVVLLPPPGALTQLGVTVADDLPLRIGETDEIENLSDEPVTVYVATLMPAEDEGGVGGSRGVGGWTLGEG